MEVLLQWLDELDDIVFAALLALHRASSAILAFGFGAAVLLVAVQPFASRSEWTIGLGAFALISVGTRIASAALDHHFPSRRTSPTA
jgi:hypothetical protein